MSQVIDLYEDSSDDNGESSTAASAPSLPLSRKRLREKEESSNDDPPRSENGTGGKTAIGSAEFAVDLEIADAAEVSISPHKKRRGVTNGEQSAKSDAAGKSAQAGGWENNFRALCEYHQSKGHCQDPEDDELLKWVFSQRCEYRRMVEGEDSILSPERVKALAGIGFIESPFLGGSWSYEKCTKWKEGCSRKEKCTKWKEGCSRKMCALDKEV
jgi:hypothetical protein